MFTASTTRGGHTSFSSLTMEHAIVLSAEGPSRPSSIPARFTWNAQHPHLPAPTPPLRTAEPSLHQPAAQDSLPY
ncbi:hypothetical protein E2C01_086484 [Portunus trituberculatus]|uniref:Uncharacterized protein n=1 Tax=Portunus trituberculatus TaxID=210409 RepID=A0A5B7JBL4_PORTR|nr:hypothetical protein [Portunus trituberculatus]